MATPSGSNMERSSTLVSLCEVRANRAAPAIVDDGDEPLAAVAREVARDLGADGVLVAWHPAGEAPTFLFAAGACEPETMAEQEMLQAATAAANATGGVPVRWAGLGDGSDADGVLTTSIPAAGGVMTVTTIFRRLGGTTRMGVRDAAMRMLPMVQGFFSIWSLRARALASNRGLTAALNSSDVATLLVDAGGRLLFANVAAERLLKASDGLRRAGALLSGTRLVDTMRLQATIEHVVNGGDAASAPSPVVALNRKDGRALLAAVVGAGQAGDAAGDAAAIVHVFDPDGDLEPLLVPVCRLYGLSPTEGRLASLLARGRALADAAREMRVQEQTARSYLKQVFLKTGTNRQAELVWLMLKSAVRTAPGRSVRFV